jgi:hypothetical protein
VDPFEIMFYFVHDFKILVHFNLRIFFTHVIICSSDPKFYSMQVFWLRNFVPHEPNLSRPGELIIDQVRNALVAFDRSEITFSTLKVMSSKDQNSLFQGPLSL